jgi:hypothetical protein
MAMIITAMMSGWKITRFTITIITITTNRMQEIIKTVPMATMDITTTMATIITVIGSWPMTKKYGGCHRFTQEKMFLAMGFAWTFLLVGCLVLAISWCVAYNADTVLQNDGMDNRRNNIIQRIEYHGGHDDEDDDAETCDTTTTATTTTTLFGKKSKRHSKRNLKSLLYYPPPPNRRSKELEEYDSDSTKHYDDDPPTPVKKKKPHKRGLQRTGRQKQQQEELVINRKKIQDFYAQQVMMNDFVLVVEKKKKRLAGAPPPSLLIRKNDYADSPQTTTNDAWSIKSKESSFSSSLPIGNNDEDEDEEEDDEEDEETTTCNKSVDKSVDKSILSFTIDKGRLVQTKKEEPRPKGNDEDLRAAERQQHQKNYVGCQCKNGIGIVAKGAIRLLGTYFIQECMYSYSWRAHHNTGSPTKCDLQQRRFLYKYAVLFLIP